jgi:hypothetical protein
MTEPRPYLKAQCLCGELQFEVADDFQYAFYCHCSLCRKRTGSAFAAIAGIDAKHMKVTKGEALKDGKNSDGYRALCGQCFTPLFSVLMNRQRAHVNLGTLQDAPTRKPDHHIYVASKASWYQIADDLPQFQELPI